MSARPPSIPTVERSVEELDRLLERIKALGPDPRDAKDLEDLVASYEYLTSVIRDKQTTIAKLREMLFGASTETRKNVLGEQREAAAPPPAATPSSRARPPGHGRHAPASYPGAARVAVAHAQLHSGDPCPHAGCRGKVYARREPRELVRIRAMVPFSAAIYEQQELRCNLCGEIVRAPLPPGVGEEKYDASVVAMIAVLRYGTGVPWHRIEQLQEGAGIPLPASTQWDLVERGCSALVPVHEELIRQAAQGELLHNDDTPMVILAFLAQMRAKRERGEDAPERTGVFTTGIVAVVGTQRVVLYFTGNRHAGENLMDVLRQRGTGLPPPLQMCDALERNLPGDLETIVGNCLTHARRQFVDVVGSFPDEVRHVLDELAIVYRHEAATKAMSAAQRLAFHQKESGPVMDRLHAWLVERVEGRHVEPNSALGEAIAYARKRWGRLTLFLREEGAALDNNVCERMLKRAILHRKNSLFYKTEYGARVGDLYMSLIATARLAGADPFDYLTVLQRHAGRVKERPGDWLPWTYRATLASLDPPAQALPAP